MGWGVGRLVGLGVGAVVGSGVGLGVGSGVGCVVGLVVVPGSTAFTCAAVGIDVSSSRRISVAETELVV